MLVSNTAILFQLRSQGDLDVGQAVLNLSQRPLGIIVILLFGLVIATMITQAFQFEAIRLLEGYWYGRYPFSALINMRIRRHVTRRKNLESAYSDCIYNALVEALRAAVTKAVPPEDILAMKALVDDRVRGQDQVARIEEAEAEILWTKHVPPELLQKLEEIRRRKSDYPEEERVLPTVLGNTLRSREDALQNVDGDLEGFVIKNYDAMPAHLRTHHDQFRNRLDMYCSLVFVFCALTVLGPALLAPDRGRYFLASQGAVVLYLSLALLCYSAAIASARGYGAVLVMIDERLGEKRAKDADSKPSTSLILRYHRDFVRWALRRRD